MVIFYLRPQSQLTPDEDNWRHFLYKFIITQNGLSKL